VPVLDLLDGALTYTGRIVTGIADPQRGAPTPCETFDVEHLTGHLVGDLRWFAALPDAIDTTRGPDPDLTGVSLARVYTKVAAAARAGWHPEHLDTVYGMPYGPATGVGLAMFMLIEVLGHGWDLAVATGQPTDAGEELASAGLLVAKQLGTSLRADGMMAAPVPVPPDAPAMSRLIAYLGRDPRWHP
jgi:uncharacterized protein (TIGR03086 family)